jgi:hypothetical protein
MYKIDIICGECGGTKEKPYFWCILKWYENLLKGESGAWCNDSCGWSVSIEQAFTDAKIEYDRIISK